VLDREYPAPAASARDAGGPQQVEAPGALRAGRSATARARCGVTLATASEDYGDLDKNILHT
jgi:hypothetical protein